MMNTAELVKTTRLFAKEEVSRSWFHLITTATVLITLGAVSLMALPLPVRLIASVLYGLTLVRMFIIYHDHMHGAIFTNSPAGRTILRTFGIFVLNPPTIWRRSHNYHHQNNSQLFTASIGSFPIMTRRDFERAKPSRRLSYLAARHWLTIAMGYVTIFLFGMCVSSLVKDPKRHWDSAVALAFHAALIAAVSYLGGLESLVFFVLIPFSVAFALGAYLFYIQHNFLDMKLKPREDWEFGYAALNSSSCMDTGPIMRWFTGNIGYHHIHHLNHLIPFYKLPEVMAAIPELQGPGRTSLSPREIVRCLSLKLWDAEAGRMITLREHRGSWIPFYFGSRASR